MQIIESAANDNKTDPSVPRQKQLAGVHAARGIAAFLVVLHHCAGTLALAKYAGAIILGGFFIPFGRAGVDFFFVLSGFIMLWIHEKDIGRPDRLTNYAWKRVTRIYPLYLVVLAGLVTIYFARPALGQGYEREISAIVTGIFLLPAAHPPIVGVAWTLSHELLFYAVFSTLLVSRKVGILVLSAWLVGLVLARFFDPSPYPMSFLLDVKNIEFFFGMAVAALALRRRPDGRLWGTLFAGVTIFIVTAVLELNTFEFRHSVFTLLYGAGAALVLYTLVTLERAKKLSAPNGLLVMLGDASYSIYLVHFTILVFIVKILSASGILADLPGWILMLIISAAATLFGYAVHRCIEIPLNRGVGRLRFALPIGRPQPGER